MRSGEKGDYFMGVCGLTSFSFPFFFVRVCLFLNIAADVLALVADVIWRLKNEKSEQGTTELKEKRFIYFSHLAKKKENVDMASITDNRE